MPQRSAEVIQVLTTVNSRLVADRIGRKLLRDRLAACVQVLGPVESRYWWNNTIEHAREWLCMIKARASDYHRVEAAIRNIHPYEVPEIVSIPILDGSAEYLTWIRNETTRTGKAREKHIRT